MAKSFLFRQLEIFPEAPMHPQNQFASLENHGTQAEKSKQQSFPTCHIGR
jgi:hypothetical protein